MEYININSITRTYTTPPELRRQLLLKYDPMTPAEYVMTTDALELLRGEELIKRARREGRTLLPLKRACYIKDTQNFPKRVILEITSICNSNCTMCPRNALIRKQEHMDTDLCKKIIGELAQVGISGLWLMNLGEPLLHPDFFEILKYCRSFETLGPLWISTNGRIFDAVMQAKVLEQPVDFFNYSVNAMTEESYKKIAPDLDFKTTQKNIQDFIKLKKSSGRTKPIIRVQMIEIPYVMEEIDSFIREFGDKADIVAINHLEKFSQNVDANNVDGQDFSNTYIEKCNRLERKDFIVFADGSVTCCDTDFNGRLTIGNMKDHSFQELMNGDEYLDIIRQYRAGRLHEHVLCSRCRDYML